MSLTLPADCERALLERFLRAEAMALWAVRSAQEQDVPRGVLNFLRRHEADEQRHLALFARLLGVTPRDKTALPRVPTQWCALAVYLYGYEALGLEFAGLLAGVRPDLGSILEDERTHVRFFERQILELLASGEAPAVCARTFAAGWWRRLPITLGRYLADPALAPFKAELHRTILSLIAGRFAAIGLLPPRGGESAS
ncbi:ferritin-like domain-containing protein [Candidatus Nitrospira bockiana]